MRQAFDALNRMIEQREAGEAIDPGFESFMEQFGDLFPGDPKDLDELLEQLAARMAAAQAMWNSMSPEQRAQLQGLAESLLEDMDLRWQVDRLAQNLQQAFPDAGWENRFRFRGDDPMGMGEATDAAGRLRDLDELEGFLRSANSPAALSEVDLDKVARSLGEDAAKSLDRLAKLAKQLEEAGPDRPARGPLRADPEGHPPDRPTGPVRPVRPADQGPGRQPRHHVDRYRPRPRGDDEALRVRRSRSTSTCPGPCTTPSAGPGAACRSSSTPTTSRSSRPRR